MWNDEIVEQQNFETTKHYVQRIYLHRVCKPDPFAETCLYTFLLGTLCKSHYVRHRVSNQLSDGLIFGRLFQANERFSAFQSCVSL